MSAEARDLRELLGVVREALAVPGGDPYNRRVADRALWAEVVIELALEDPTDELPRHVDYLRRKLQADEAASK